jgi:hypothetical protein
MPVMPAVRVTQGCRHAAIRFFLRGQRFAAITAFTFQLHNKEKTMGLDQMVAVIIKEPLGYWRKHPNLHGWMEDLWLDNGGAGVFNCVDLPLSEQDILDCMDAIRNDRLPHTEGFFFGETDHSEEQQEEDLRIMEICLAAVRNGKEVVYSSWW